MDKQIFLLKLNEVFAEIAKYARGYDYDKTKIQDFLPTLNHRFGKWRGKEHPYRPCKFCKKAEIRKDRWERGERDCTYCRQKKRNRNFRAKLRRIRNANLQKTSNGNSKLQSQEDTRGREAAKQDPRH